MPACRSPVYVQYLPMMDVYCDVFINETHYKKDIELNFNGTMLLKCTLDDLTSAHQLHYYQYHCRYLHKAYTLDQRPNTASLLHNLITKGSRYFTQL